MIFKRDFATDTRITVKKVRKLFLSSFIHETWNKRRKAFRLIVKWYIRNHFNIQMVNNSLAIWLFNEIKYIYDASMRSSQIEKFIETFLEKVSELENYFKKN